MQEHIKRIALHRALRSALVKYQAKYDVSDTYGILQCVTKQLYNDGFLEKSWYDELMLEYSKKLTPYRAVEVSPEQNHAKFLLLEKEKDFSRVIADWNMPHSKANWREHWVSEAQKYLETVSNAKLVLDMVNK